MTGNLQWWACSLIQDLFENASGENASGEFFFRSNSMRARAVAQQILGRRKAINLKPVKKWRGVKATPAGTVLINQRTVVYYRKVEEETHGDPKV